MKIRSLLSAFAMVLGLGSIAQANNLVRTVDSFAFLVDYSGSMMMSRESTKIPKIEIAKEVLSQINRAIPNLGYMSSMYTIAPSKTLVPHGNWEVSVMDKAIQGLETNLPIFGRQTFLGNNIARFGQKDKVMLRPTAVILVSDGHNNVGYSPVKEIENIMKTQPGACFHIISFADTAEGQDVLEQVAKLSDCSVMVNGIELYNNQEAVEKFVAAVFYDDLISDALDLRGVNFAFDSIKNGDKGRDVSEKVVSIRDIKSGEVILKGRINNVNSEAYGQVISKRRADSVKTYLVKKGVPTESVKEKGVKSKRFQD